MRAIGGTKGVGCVLPTNAIGDNNFKRYIGDRLVLDMHEGAENTVRDLSGNSNDGTLGAGAATPTWERNRLSFDGSDYISLGNFIRPVSSITLSSQVKIARINNYRCIIGGDDSFFGSAERSFWLRIDKTTGYAKIIVFVGAIAYEIAGTTNRNSLDSSIVGTYDGNIVRIFANATEENNDNTMNGDIDSGMGIAIGRASDEWSAYYFDGLISFIRINAIAFSTPQVLAEYLWNKWRN